jgi:hypothetical protein
MEDGLEDPLEGPAELHGFRWCQADGVGIDAIEGVVDDDARPAVTLGHNSKGAEAEVGEVSDQGVGE